MPFFRYLDTNGNGTGTKNANGNYASAADDFYIDADEAMKIYRMIVYIEDVGTFDSGVYGSAITLTNGIRCYVADASGTEVQDLFDGVDVFTNDGWARVCHDLTIHGFAAGNTAATVRWTFSNAGGPIFLPEGYRLVVTLNDNLSGLVSHYFNVQGVYV